MIIGFNEGEVAVRGDREADGADARVEVEDFVGGDVAFDFGEGSLVDWEVDLEKSIRGI